MSKPAIQVDNISKLYHIGRKSSGSLRESISAAVSSLWNRQPESHPDETEFWALKDISFTVNQGDVVGIIGKNGAGKSTLLKILSRITEPTTGRIQINGRVGSLLEVGTGFHPELTGRENIFLNGSILGMRRSEIQSKFDEIVAFSGIEKFIDTPVKRYSSGMYVRLAFSVAAHLEPEVLIIDEVLAVGDAEFQKKCLGKMQDVAGHGRTILFVSHNMGAVRNLCNKGILLLNGTITKTGEIQGVVEAYLRPTGFQQSNGRMSWSKGSRPSCFELEIEEVRTETENGIVQGNFFTDQEVIVIIRYNILKELSGSRIVMNIVNNQDEILFASTNHMTDTTTKLPGTYETSCKIIKSLLKDGVYKVQFRIGIPGFQILIDTFDTLFFELDSTGSHGSTFSENWPGIIAPALSWKTELLFTE